MGVLIFWSILIGVADIGLSDAALCQGRNFVLSSIQVQQAPAKSACNNGGGNLASIPDEATQNHLSTLASNKVGNGWNEGSNVYAFIGGERTGNDFKWPDGTIFATESGGSWSTPVYDGWTSGSGPSGSGTCMTFQGARSGSRGSYTYTWKWGDAGCTGTYYYICENQVDRTLTVTSSNSRPTMGTSLTFTGTISGFYNEPLNVVVAHGGTNTNVKSNFVGTSFTYVINPVSLSHTGDFVFTTTNSAGSCSGSTRVTITVVPTQPTSVTLTPSTTGGSSQIQVAWTAVNGVTGYRVNWNHGGAQQRDVSSGTTTTIITGLTPGKTYSVDVRSKSGSVVSGLASRTTTTAPSIPSTVALTPSTTGASSQVTISWSAVAGNVVTGYRVTWSPTGGSPTQPLNVAATATTTTVSSLTPGQAYTFEVRAKSGSVLGSPASSSITPVSSLESPAVTLTQSTSGGKSQITVQWTAVSGATSGYSVTWTPNGGSVQPRNVAADTTTTTISDLTPGQTYTVDVKAKSGTTTSDPSSKSIITAPSPPNNVRFTPSQTQITISWTNAPGVVTSYFVYWKLVGSVSSVSSTVIPSKTSYTFTGLTSMKRYEVKISSKSGSVQSTWVTKTTSTGSVLVSFAVTSPLTVTFEVARSVTCTCSGYYEPQCRWFRSNSEQTTVTSAHVYQTSTTASGSTSGTSTLHINIADPSYAGHYECKANWDGTETKTKTLTIYVRPTIATSRFAIDFPSYNTPQQVYCESQGHPKPTVDWTRSGSSVATSTGLTIRQYEANSTGFYVKQTLDISLQNVLECGEYVCKVTSPVGSEQKSVTITVQPNVTLSSNELSASHGESRIVTCTSYGYPMPKITWKKSTLLVSSDTSQQYYQTISTDSTNYGKTANLHLTNIDIGLSESYYCEANNTGADQSETFQLMVRANITLSPLSTWRVTQFPETFYVDCVSFGWRQPNVHWSRNGQNITTSASVGVHQVIGKVTAYKTNSRLHFTATSIEQVGAYKCTASNNNHPSVVNTTFYLQAKANIHLSKTTVSVTHGARSQVNCTSFGFPQPEVYWTKNLVNVSTNTGEGIYQTVHKETAYKIVASLDFVNPSPTTTGSFVCHASNTVGENNSTSLQETLTVAVAPRFLNASSPAAEFSQLQTLNCTFTADQSTTFHWTINDQNVTINSDASPTYVTNHRTDNIVTSQLIVNASVIFGANATAKCWAKNKAGTSENATIVLNTDIQFLGGHYYNTPPSELDYPNAEKYCTDHGGELPSATYVTNNFLPSIIAALPNGVWVQGNDSVATHTPCLKADNTSIYAAACIGNASFGCVFPVIEILEVSNCHPDSIELKWKDKAKLQAGIPYRFTAKNGNTGESHIDINTTEHSPTNSYSAKIGGLTSDVQYTLQLELFPAISKFPEGSTTNGSTSSIFQSVTGEMNIQGDECVITITIPDKLLTDITDIKLVIEGPGAETPGNVTEISKSPASSVEHRVKVNEGESVKVKFQPVTSKCQATNLQVSGTCQRAISETPTTDQPNPTSSLPLGAIGGGVGAFVLLVIVVVALLVFNRSTVRSWSIRRRNTHDNELQPIQARRESVNSFSEEENPYGDVGVVKAPDDDTTRIAVTSLKEAYLDSIDSNHANLNQQFSVIKTSTVDLSSKSVAKKEENAKRNRYKNIIPYDNNFVHLQNTDNSYINGSFIKDYKKRNKWIATQGPTQNTVNDFWMMIWQQNTGVIVMLANLFEKGKSKCAQYWPDLGESSEFGEFTVKTTDVINKGCYVIRRITLEQSENAYANELRTITQFHFTAWPDHGVPATTSGLLRLHQDVNDQLKDFEEIRPTAVHCSAGAGRTGTFIGLDYLLEEMKTRSSIDVYQAVLHMRDQRMEMVQTVLQYVFLHKLLYETQVLGVSDKDVPAFMEEYNEMEESLKNNAIDNEFKKLELAKSDRPNQPLLVKNQRLARYAPNSDVLSAYAVEAYNSVDELIVSTQPNKETAAEFWSMIVEKKISTIIMLKSKNDYCYWPTSQDSGEDFGDTTVIKTSESVGSPITQRSFTLDFKKGSSKIFQLELSDWSENDVPKEDLIIELLSVIDLHLTDTTNKNMVVLAKSDLTRPAMFCVYWNLVARYKAEMMVDVYRAFKDTKDCLPGVTFTKALYKSSNDLMKHYIGLFSNYANVTN